MLDKVMSTDTGHISKVAKANNWLMTNNELVKMREEKQIELEHNMNEIVDSGGVDELASMRCAEILRKQQVFFLYLFICILQLLSHIVNLTSISQLLL